MKGVQDFNGTTEKHETLELRATQLMSTSDEIESALSRLALELERIAHARAISLPFDRRINQIFLKIRGGEIHRRSGMNDIIKLGLPLLKHVVESFIRTDIWHGDE